MMEVETRNDSEARQTATLEELAKRINEQHRASGLALGNALDHAMAAGDLLLEARAECKHGTWLPWLKGNFAGTPRTAQLYMNLARERTAIEDLKAKSVSLLTIGAAMDLIAGPKEPPEPLWQRNLPFNPDEQPGPVPDVAEALEAEQAASGAQKQRNREALDRLRAAERLGELCDMIKVLDQLVPKYPPDEAGAALAAWTGEGRGLAALRDIISWLQQVLDAADQAQGQ